MRTGADMRSWVALLHAALACSSEAHLNANNRRGLTSRAAWAGTGCPCANASLCEPIRRRGPVRR